MFALFGIIWVLPYSVRDTLLGWRGINMGKKGSKVWMATPLCLFWAVWKERNRIAFENEELSIYRLKNSFVCNLWFWTKSVVNEGPLPLISFFIGWVLVEGWFVSPLLFVLAFWLLLYTVYPPCMLLG